MVLSSWRWPVAVALGCAVLLAACGGDGGADGTPAAGAAGGDGPYLVATTGIWADVVERVACDGPLDVRTIVPAGGDPHSFEPSLQDRHVLDGATLVVANGLGLEATLDDTLDSVEDGGVPIFRIGEHIDTIQLAGEGEDPHVWFDPTRVAGALPALGDALVAAGQDAAVIDRCVSAAQTDLVALDTQLAATLGAVPADRRLLVTNHDALGYLADRYGFEVVGSVLPSTSTLTEASPGELDGLAKAIEARHVPAIFTETLASSTDADALADRLGVAVVQLYSDALGEPGSGADTYDGLLRTDATSIADALTH